MINPFGSLGRLGPIEPTDFSSQSVGSTSLSQVPLASTLNPNLQATSPQDMAQNAGQIKNAMSNIDPNNPQLELLESLSQSSPAEVVVSAHMSVIAGQEGASAAKDIQKGLEKAESKTSLPEGELDESNVLEAIALKKLTGS